MTIDIGSILSRAFNIVKNNRALWLLGFLAALGGGSGGGSFNFPSGGSSGGGGRTPGTGGLGRAFPNISNENMTAIAGIIIALVCVFAAIGLILAILGLIANGGLIAGAKRADAGQPVTFRESWAAATPKFWRLLGMRLLLALPNLILGVIIVIAFVGALAAAGGIAAMGNKLESGDGAGGILAAFSGVLCIFVPIACVLWVYSIVAGGIRMYADRLIVLDDVPAIDSIKRGWDLFKSNLSNTIVIGIILAVIGVAVSIATVIVGGIVLVPPIALAVAQTTNTPSNAIGAGLIALIVVAGIVFIIIAAAIGALLVAFRATAWTVLYGQLTGQSPSGPVADPVYPPLPPDPSMGLGR